jgi:hypothetical protein
MEEPIEIIKPPNDWHAGTQITIFRRMLIEKSMEYPKKQFMLDLSEVEYMDSCSFRVVFDFLPMFGKVIPPKIKHIIMMYDQWLESKKGLEK